MDSYAELKIKYNKLLDEYETYQNFAESNIQMLSEKISNLEKKLDVVSSVAEISKYINSNVTGDSILANINDMIIGIMGANYSTIYFKDGEEFSIKASNILNNNLKQCTKKIFDEINSGEPFILNSKEDLFNFKTGIHSVLGAPIYLRNEYKGYVIVEQRMFGFFSDYHMNFISAITNQIAIAIQNSILYKAVVENSIRDPLLGIYNRKYFFEIMENKSLTNAYYGILMMDIDNFKSINDRHGHQFGDEVLISTSSMISNEINDDGILARYGGEELVAFINDASDYKRVYNKVEDIRRIVEKNIIKKLGKEDSVTISIGLAHCIKKGQDFNQVIAEADEALYIAKASGKNKVVEYNYA